MHRFGTAGLMRTSIAGVTLAGSLCLSLTAAFSEDAAIGPDAWRELTAGKTLHYYRDGELYGREFYHPGGDRVEFCSAGGVHAEGRWAYQDGTYCFAYFGDLHCFRHLMRDGEIYVIDVNGEEDEQKVDHISDGGPIPCGAGSQA